MQRKPIVPPLDSEITTAAGSAMFGPTGPEIGRQHSETRTLGLGWLLYGFVRAIQPEIVLEVGFGGSSACILYALRHNQKGKLVVMDPKDWGPDHPTKKHKDGSSMKIALVEVYDVLDTLGFWDICEFYHEKSQDFGPKWNKPIDMLVVDGDHSFDAVRSDFLCFAPFVKLGGYAFFHDMLACVRDIGANVEELASSDKWSMLIEPDHLSMAIIQRRYTASTEKLHFTNRLAHMDNPDRETTDIHLTNARRIPGLLMPWEGSWFDTVNREIGLDKFGGAEAQKGREDAEKLIAIRRKEDGL